MWLRTANATFNRAGPTRPATGSCWRPGSTGGRNSANMTVRPERRSAASRCWSISGGVVENRSGDVGFASRHPVRLPSPAVPIRPSAAVRVDGTFDYGQVDPARHGAGTRRDVVCVGLPCVQDRRDPERRVDGLWARAIRIFPRPTSFVIGYPRGSGSCVPRGFVEAALKAELGIFAQDQWTTGKMTLNLGSASTTSTPIRPR